MRPRLKLAVPSFSVVTTTAELKDRVVRSGGRLNERFLRGHDHGRIEGVCIVVSGRLAVVSPWSRPRPN